MTGANILCTAFLNWLSLQDINNICFSLIQMIKFRVLNDDFFVNKYWRLLVLIHKSIITCSSSSTSRQKEHYDWHWRQVEGSISKYRSGQDRILIHIYGSIAHISWANSILAYLVVMLYHHYGIHIIMRNPCDISQCIYVFLRECRPICYEKKLSKAPQNKSQRI